MSMTALPLTVGDVQNVQIGVGTFTDMAAAQLVVNGSNATPATTSLFAYANSLVSSAFNNKPIAGNFAAVAISVDNLVLGGVPPAGALNAAGAITPNELQNLAINFSPPQANLANSLGLASPTVYVTEQMAQGLAAVGDTNLPGSAFVTKFGLSTTTPPTQAQVQAFAQAIFLETGSAASTTFQEANFWINFYTKNGVPPGVSALPAWIAGLAAAAGDAIGQAIVGNSSGTNFSQQLVFNALVDNAEQIGGVKNADGTPVTYQVGKPLNAQQVPVPLQGQNPVPPTTVFLTQGNDTTKTGFASDANGTPLVPPGFTATVANTVFNALPFVTSLGLANNTLNTGDDLEATGAAAGATTLNLTTTSFMTPANPSFAQGITMNGVNTLNITNNSTNPASPIGGFAGTVKGLLVETNTNSVNPVTLGATGQGLGTLLTDIKINGYAGLPGSDINTVILAAGVADLTKTINVALTGGNLGTTAADAAQELAIASDAGTGTAAAPNNTYGTWALTINNNANLQLEQSVTTTALGAIATEGGVGGATTLSLAGKGNVGLGQALAGDWQKVVTINAGGESGNVIIPGATTALQPGGTAANALYNSLSSAANPFWLFGSDFGLLDDTGAAFNLKEYDLGSGLNVLDVSTATAAQIGALKTVANATPSTGNFIIVQDSVATTTSATTFANIAGFQVLGIGGATPAQGANGTINMANLPASINTIDYFTPAAGSVIITNAPTALTVNVFDQTVAGQNLTVGSPAGLTDSLTVSLGNANHNATIEGVTGTGVGVMGDITATGEEVFTLIAQGAVAGGAVITDVVNRINLTPTIGGNVQAAIQGNTTLEMSGLFEHDPGSGFISSPSTLTVVDTDTAGVQMFTGIGFTLTPGNFLVPLQFSTNAISIDATNSGGLFMMAGDFSTTFAGSPLQSSGVVIKGSMTSTKGDVLAGSIGNDTISANDVGFADTVVTFGGADKITLATGHTGHDVIDLYAGSTGVLFFGGGDMPATPGSVVFAGVPADVPEPGWWGQGSGSVPVGYTGAPGASVYAGLADFTGTGTPTHPANLSVVNGFIPGQDIVSFSVSSFGGAVAPNGLAAGALGFGLVDGGNFETALFGAQAVAVQQVNPGGVLAAGTNIIELTTGSFANANAVVQSLQANYDIVFNTGAFAAFAGDSFHVLVAYQLQGSGAATNIMDLAVNTQSFGTVFHTEQSIPLVNHLDLHGSDVIELVGVNVTQLANANFHIVA